jgi:hypothetical protein
MEILSDKTVTTRKRHICDACNRPMPIGTKMRTCFIVDGGDNWTWRECPTCAELLIDYREEFENYDNGYDNGCVREVCNGLTPEELLSKFNSRNALKAETR